MVCPNCSTSNRDSARFCKECGRYLLESCYNCGSVLPDMSKFCDFCGYRVSPSAISSSEPPPSPSLSSQSQPAYPSLVSSDRDIGENLPRELLASMKAAQAPGETPGERRVVTMLFCDVKGSTEAAEKLDPEEWAEIINEAFEYMIGPVYHYEGTVARLMGDGILAFFGAPTAHEDDPIRAVLTGLDIITGIAQYRQEIRRSYNIDFNVRVGINTGRVVVGAVGSDVHHEYSALGDAINVAARMEQSASPGTVLIAEDTHNLVKPVFEFEEMGPLAIKGKEKPVEAFRVLGRVSDPGRLRGIAGRQAPLVGREKEIKFLQEASDSLSNGQGGIRFLVGEAGIGKTRLLREIQDHWQTNSHSLESDNDLSWIYLTTASYERRDAYGVLRNLLRSLYEFDEEDAEDQILDHLNDSIKTLTNDQRTNAANVLLDLLGMDVRSDSAPLVEGEAYRRLLYKATHEILRSKTSTQPLVLLIDNLHWMDAASAALFQHLFQLADIAPILFVFAMRPDTEAVSWDVKSNAEKEFPHRCQQLTLKPLTADECLTLSTLLLDSDDLPERLIELIWTHSDGNPYFIEEIIRTLIDSGALIRDPESKQWQLTAGPGAIIIPEKLESLLAARVDVLGEEARRVLQTAAVIGVSFQYGIMEKILKLNGHLDRSLSTLQQRDFIVQVARDVDRSYTFRSPLLQETVYKSILRRVRSEYHRSTARAIEDLYRDNLEDRLPELAHHYYQAGDPLALPYLQKAGDAAFQLYANKEAEEYYSHALEIALLDSNLSVTQITYLFEQRGRALELDSQFPEALKNYEEMEKLAGERQEAKMELDAVLAQTTIYTMATEHFNPDKAEQLALRALETAEAQNDRASESKIYWNLLNVYRFAGSREKALQYGERSLALARELNLQEQIAYSANDICHVYTDLGKFQKAKEIIDTASDLWREMDNRPMLADSLATASIVSALMGRFELAIAQSEEAFQISETIENGWGQSYSRLFTGSVYWEMGDPDRAIEMMESSIRFGREVDFIVASTYVGPELARVHVYLGDLERAAELASDALQISVDYIPTYRPMALSALGLIHLLRGEREALDDIVNDLHGYSDLHIASFAAEVSYFICLCQTAENQLDSAADIASKQVHNLTKNNALTLLPRMLYLQGHILRKKGQLDESIRTLDQAQSTAESIGARWSLSQILAAKARLQKDMGDPTAAANNLNQAHKVLETIAANISADGKRETFLASPYVRWFMDGQLDMPTGAN